MVFCIGVLLLVAIGSLVVATGSILRWRDRLHKATLRQRPATRRVYGYIYFFRGRYEPFWMVKVGRTTDLQSRLRAHRTANPYGIRVLCVFKTRNAVVAERFLHRLYYNTRVSRSNEWFYMSPLLWLSMQLLMDRDLTTRTNYVLRSKP